MEEKHIEESARAPKESIHVNGSVSSDYFYAMSRNGMEGSNRIERRKV